MKSLRVFQILPNSATIPSSRKSRIWKSNMYDPLIYMEHDVFLVDFEYDEFFVHAENESWLAKNRPFFSSIVERAFVQQHQKKPFDFAFIYVCDGFLERSVLDRIRSNGVPIFNFSCNNNHQFHLIRDVSKQVDCSIYTEKCARQSFDAIGVRSFHMPMAANPKLYKPLELPLSLEVTFVGQRYADRGELVARLVREGIPIRIYGPKWQQMEEQIGTYRTKDRFGKLFTIAKQHGLGHALSFLVRLPASYLRTRRENKILKDHVGPILEDEEMIRVFNQSRINLGFGAVFDAGREGGEKKYHVRLRDFEVPMCGAFYLPFYIEELEEYFVIGKELDCYRNEEDLLDKVRYYLKNDAARERIRWSGYHRSIQSHTWEKRFEKLFDSGVFSSLVGTN